MQVILLERIEKLGQMGDVVEVRSGYARNYLLPQKKALRATEENRLNFAEQRTELEATNLERRKDAEDISGKLDGLSVTLVRQAGEAGQLYGSVKARDVADVVGEAGFRLNRQQVNLDRPIKALGIHAVRVDLHPEVSVRVYVNVARSAEEAEVQAKTGRALIYRDEEVEDRAEVKTPDAATAKDPAPTPEEEAKEVPAEAAAGDEAKEVPAEAAPEDEAKPE